MMDIEKSSLKISSTITNIGAAVAGIGIILGGFYAIQDKFHERNLATAREIMQDVMDDQDLLTAAEFEEYTTRQEIRNKNIQEFTLNYMASIDSALLIVLPKLAANDREISRQLKLLETKIEANNLTATDDKIDRVWQFLESQAKKDSTEKRHREIMQLLKTINEQKFKGQTGDRVQ